MHPIQEKIIQNLQERDEIRMTLRQLGELVGDPHPQKIKHHLTQLEKRGFIKIDKETGAIRFIGENCELNPSIFNIPIMGAANCGPANLLATNSIEGFLKVSQKILPNNFFKKGVFAVKATGSSMNRADIKGQHIDDGDYALIDSTDPTVENGAYVLSIIDGYANIKRIYCDEENQQVVLLSESSQDYPPIYIHKEDLANYLIAGRVKYVLKKPIVSWG